MSLEFGYRVPEDPLMAKIHRVLGDAGVNAWNARCLVAMTREMEKQPLTMARYVEIRRQTLKETQEEVLALRDLPPGTEFPTAPDGSVN